MIDSRDPGAIIADLRAEGLTYRQVAARLNAAGVPTRTGRVGVWQYGLVRQYDQPAAWSAYMRAWRADRRARA